MKLYEVRDPIHGFIEFNDWEREIINHRAFQRLRRIKQLALTEMVYPGAMHTRFEHSLGVMHLSTKMFDSIIKREENKRLLKDLLGYDEAGFMRDRQLVRLAALLHDVGCAPFSHASEELTPINETKDKHFKHEDYTVAIIKGPLKDVIESHKLNKINYNIKADDIAALIEGNIEILGPRAFWKVLISSQLDADRCDYLLRDSLHIGVRYGVYDIERLLITITLGKDLETEDIILGINEGGWHVAESLIIARYQMFAQVYYHKTRRAYDFMLKEAIKETIGRFPPPDKIQEYLIYDDFYMWKLMREKSQWFENILRRNHIRMIEETSEIPTGEEYEFIEVLKNRLSERNIWLWEDTAEEVKSWYKIRDKEEIYVIKEDLHTEPLSNYSHIVKHLGAYARIRIYVRQEDRSKAIEIKKAIINKKEGG